MPETILMPALSAGMEEGTIARWLKAEGDIVAAGEVIAEIETDKATMEFEAARDGVLGKILVTSGSAAAVNAAIATLLIDGEPAAETESFAVHQETRGQVVPFQASTADPRPAARIASSPLARRIALERGVALEGLAGSGPRGRIVRLDVERARPPASAPAAQAGIPAPSKSEARDAPAPSAPHRQIPNNAMRKVIARRLTEAKATIPHFYLNVHCEIDALLELRETLNAQSQGRYKLSVNDLVVKAAALALREVPDANAAWTEDAVLLFDDVDISVAVSTDGGLITPIVRQADRKGLGTLSAEVRELAERARAGKLRSDEYQGGTFTISNLGMFGVHSFSAIINPPQSCILAIGAGERRAVVRGDQCVPATVMTCTLSVDHRSVDGAIGARYIAAFKAFIEHPMRLML